MFSKVIESLKRVFGGGKCTRDCCKKNEQTTKPVSDDELREIIKTKGLNHIAIIPDGDRRWAMEYGLHPSEGHRKSYVDLAPEYIASLMNLGIPTITLWVTSPENWKRSKEEMDNLSMITGEFFKKILPIAQKNECRIAHLGRNDRIPLFLKETIDDVQKQTTLYSKHFLNVGVDYGGRDEICRACQKIIEQKISFEKLNPEIFANFLDTAQQMYPYPDLVIRSGGELRLSGFMLWQIASSELCFSKIPFPAFDFSIITAAIVDFGKRGRRFGGN